MKQITYDFDWMTIAGALVGSLRTSGGVEDGFWQICVITESLTAEIAAPAPEATQQVLPGHLVRIKGIRLQRVSNLGPMCIQVSNGLITEVGIGSNTNHSRSLQSSKSPGENSDSA
jgi:hypothetical protein